MTFSLLHRNPRQDSNLKTKGLAKPRVQKRRIFNEENVWLPTLDTFRTFAA